MCVCVYLGACVATWKCGDSMQRAICAKSGAMTLTNSGAAIISRISSTSLRKSTSLGECVHGQNLRIASSTGLASFGSFSTNCVTQYESCWWYMPTKRTCRGEGGRGRPSCTVWPGAVAGGGGESLVQRQQRAQQERLVLLLQRQRKAVDDGAQNLEQLGDACARQKCRRVDRQGCAACAQQRRGVAAAARRRRCGWCAAKAGREGGAPLCRSVS